MVKKSVLLLLLACALLALPAGCTAAGYRVTEQELTQLETNIAKLQQINKASQQELQTLQEQLATLKTESITLQNQLAELKATSEMQEQSLKTANESLAAYAAEVKRKQKIIKRQRTLAYVLAAGVIAVAIAK